MNRYFPYLPLLRPVRGIFVLGIVCGLIYGISTGFGIPFMFEKVFPRIFQSAPGEAGAPGFWQILGYAAILPGVFFIRGLSGWINSTAIGYSGLVVLEQLRQKLFDRLLAVELSSLQAFHSGDLISRVTGDTALIQTTLTEVANDIVKQPITFLGAFSVLIYLSFSNDQFLFILFCLGVVPIMVFPLRYFGRKLLKKAREQQESLGDLTGVVSESLASAREIRAYSLEGRQSNRFAVRLKVHLKAQFRVIAYGFALSPSIEVISAFGIAGAFLYSFYAGIPLESFLALAAALYFSYDPIKKMGTIHNRLQKGIGALDRIEAVLAVQPGPVEQADPKPLSRGVTEGLLLREVEFSYGSEPVLRGVDLVFAPGDCVALVGPSGAGKTTLMNLIPRFFDPTQGGVVLDGKDLRDVSLAELRQLISLVPQEPTLFPDSIRENIRLGRPDATDAEVEDAARMAGLHDTVLALDAGYAARVGEGGAALSGGQKQRLALARAFLRGAPILLLDEPTSALDGENEARLRANLEGYVKNRICLIIAHRYDSLKLANRVLVMEDGQVVGDGKLDELAATNPVFRRIFSL